MSRRFYTEARAAKCDDGWCVELDGKPIKTPTGKALVLMTAQIASRVAREWAEQGEEILPGTMPLTRLANVAAERASEADQLIADIVAYAGTDLLSYRKDAPEDLAERQSAAYDPILEWSADRGISLQTTLGILAIDQDPLCLERLAEHARKYDALALTLFAHLSAVYGSAILALAVMQGEQDAGEAFDLSRTEESYRAQVWGEDEDTELNAANTRAETVAMAAILSDMDIAVLKTIGTL